VLLEGDPEAAGVIQAAIEDFAKELATVTGRFLRTKEWKGTERIAVGGGLRASRVGELAIGRASVILKSEGHAVDLVPIGHDPDEAGLVGTIHLAPAWIFAGYDAVLAVDIGGSNFRAGIVAFGTSKKSHDLAAAAIHASVLWRHCDEKPKRNEAVERLVQMLEGLMKRAAKDGLSLAPFIGIGCPGVIEEDGSIARGGQNLPGNWESSRFNLPAELCEAIPKIGEHHTHVVMHNDAVVQGLSEVPTMSDVEHWGVLTIGTGLGNARFTNRPTESVD
jgi:predicted NBD/HSP70 family sugar kinase